MCIKNTDAFNQRAEDEKKCELEKKVLNKKKVRRCNTKYELHTECKIYPIGLEKKLNSTQSKIGYGTCLSELNAEK